MRVSFRGQKLRVVLVLHQHGQEGVCILATVLDVECFDDDGECVRSQVSLVAFLVFGVRLNESKQNPNAVYLLILVKRLLDRNDSFHARATVFQNSVDQAQSPLYEGGV